MGIALTDVLVELSSPKTQLEFKRDPRKFLDARPLTDSEKNALLGGSLLAEVSAAKLMVEGHAAKLLVETDASPTSGCVEWVGRTFVDDGGRLYRLESDSV